MKIKVTGLGKRFNRDWIFRNLDFNFEGKHYAITGPNGSGKSTLLQILSGSSSPNEGNVDYVREGKAIKVEEFYHHISICAPYLELVEEMDLLEFFSFHEKMKGWLPAVRISEMIEMIGLKNATHKQIRYYSSGMKQRVKLAQAIFSNVPVVLLDEPLTNLDEEGIELYNRLIENYCRERLLIISSNDKKEYAFCEDVIDMRTYK